MYQLDVNKLNTKLVQNQNLSDQRVLLRTCLNVTTDDTGAILDDTRLVESLPCIERLIRNSRQLIITAHLGRPKEPTPSTSLAKVAKELELRLGQTVHFVSSLDDVSIDRIQSGVDRIVMVENIRYFPEEDSKDPAEQQILLDKLTSIADVFVNDAFADYRKSVSTYYIAKKLPSFVGPLFAKEVTKLTKLNNAQHPFVAIIGGSKLSEKIDTVVSLCEIADKVIVGGGIPTTIMKSQGKEIGKSLCESDKLDIAAELYNRYKDKIVMPLDFVVTTEFKNPETKTIVSVDSIPADQQVVDMGPQTEVMIAELLTGAQTLVANGTVGVYEFDNCTATRTVLQAMVNNTSAYKVIGGGNTIEATNKYGFSFSDFDHVSTGGGAMLAILGYSEFPILDVIINQ